MKWIHGNGKLEQLENFGNVFDYKDDFKEWWFDGNRGVKLFAELTCEKVIQGNPYPIFALIISAMTNRVGIKISLEKLLREIQSWPGVKRTETQLILSAYKNTNPLMVKKKEKEKKRNNRFFLYRAL